MADPVDGPEAIPELEDRILPWSQVKVISGLSRTTVWRLQKTGDFPASVQVSPNRVGWWQSDILEWRRSRMPRRLPEARPVAVSAEESAKFRKRVLEAAPAATVTKERSASAGRAGLLRRQRRSAQCENQTAFDF